MTIVIPRSVWEPLHDNGFAVIGTQAWLDANKELWLHHSVTTPPGPNATLAEDCAHMRFIESIGEANYGGGISYTWVVMPSGRVFQGHDIDRRGSHTYQRNDRSRGICLAGNYDDNPLPDKMARSVAYLLVELGATLDGGHRNVFATACPGEYAYARIPQINNWASTGNIPGEEDMTPQQDAALAELWATLVSGEKRDSRINEDLGYVLNELTAKLDALSVKVDAIDEKLGE